MSLSHDDIEAFDQRKKRQSLLRTSFILLVAGFWFACYISGKTSLPQTLTLVLVSVGGPVILTEAWVSWRLRNIRKWCDSQNLRLLKWRSTAMRERPGRWKNLWGVGDEMDSYEVIVGTSDSSGPYKRLHLAFREVFSVVPEVFCEPDDAEIEKRSRLLEFVKRQN